MTRTRIRLASAILAAAILTAIPLPAGSQQPLQLQIAPTATLIEGGRGIELQILASCPPAYEVLEAFAYASQPDESGGGAYSSFSPIPVRCNGRIGKYFVAVRTYEGDPAFKPGPASASSYLLVSSRPGDQTSSASDFEVVEVQ